MQRSPSISVLMSTYNRKSFLSRSIESVLAQSFADFELILINNGSTDGSDILCEMFAKQDDRIKLYKIPENHGAPIGRNKALDMASCDYVTIVDDDDFCEPQMLEFLWGLTIRNNADVAMCGSWNDYGGRKEPYFIFDELLLLDKVQGLDELLKREKFNVAPPTKLFRKSLFNDLRFKENVLVDDIHVIYKVFAKANTLVAQGKPLYYFAKHTSNMTSFIQTDKLSPTLLSEYLSAFRERTEYLCRHVPEVELRVKYSEWSYMISMCQKIKNNNITECSQLLDSMTETILANYNEIINCALLTKRERQYLMAMMHLE